jgi:hypothetical protein
MNETADIAQSGQAGAEPNVFVVWVDGDVSDAEQAILRHRGLYHGGHAGMARTANTRAGTCTTFFSVVADTAGAARVRAERELAMSGRRILRVERVDG